MNTTTNLENHLHVFKELISHLQGDNIAIGGIMALEIHGLKMSRPANDLDLIIHQPTLKQKACLNMMKIFEIENRNLTVSDYKQRSFKFKKNDFTIDILIEEKPVPLGLLYFKFNEILWPIQSVENVIDAKRSYTFTGRELKKYIREKDIADFIDLKNSNFNL